MNKNNFFAFIILSLLFVLVVFLSLFVGSSDISAKAILAALFNLEAGGVEQVIICQIRLPRLVLGLFVGAGLAVCGAVFQSTLRNPLAGPYTLGISGGSAFGATLGIISGVAGLNLALLAFLGGILSVAIIYLVAARKRFSNSALILTGIILSFTFSSLVLLLFAVSRSERVHSALLWLIGDLSSVSSPLLHILPWIVLSGISILIFFGRDINILTLGDEKALYLGVRTQSVKKIVFITASFITATCVASAGVVGFVGLMIPHFMRYFFGLNHRRLLVACSLCGAVFLVFCDLLARLIIKPIELPVGVITGFFGGVFFLIFLMRSKKWEIV